MAPFDDLSDYDFELLVADLLGAALGYRFETFPRRRDGGIDLRATLADGIHIVQCKHYARSGLSALKTAAKKEKKALSRRRRKPRKYTFVTSLRLTFLNKEELVTLLKPFVGDESDILGEDDLNALLRAHPEVERAHVKLWLRGAAQLDRIVNADVLARSEALIAEIVSDLPRYVETTSFSDAKALLAEHNVVIASGPPGVGKTTLSRLLLLDSVEANYVPYAVQSNINEAWGLLKLEQPQVFFFDDFLGRTALFEGVSQDPRDLAAFIRRVREVGASRLILATREYVLQQARDKVEDLKWKELEADRYALTLDSYSRFDRAHIFYNHIYFSEQLDSVARTDLLKHKGYLRVIDHPSYSPRLIEWITGMGGHRLAEEDRESYTNYCLSVLCNPGSVWAHAYSKGLEDRERCLLSQLIGLPSQVLLGDLELAYQAAATVRRLPAARSEFEAAVKIVQDSFVVLQAHGDGEQFLSPLNPSLIDFLKAKLLDDPEQIGIELESAYFFDQVIALYELINEAGLDRARWSTAIIGAVKRTLTKDTDRDRLVVTSRWRDNDPLVKRLQILCDWCEETTKLKSGLSVRVGIALTRLVAELPDRTVLLVELPTLLQRLDKAGFDVDMAAAGVRERSEDRLEDVESYEALVALRQLRSTMFTEEDWDEIQELFRQLGDSYLDEPTEWFDSTDDVYRFEDVASSVGVMLDDEKIAAAEADIEQLAAEKVERAMEEIDPDDYTDRSEVRERSDNKDIESLFGTLDK
jgi:DNA polymerase III delta prime subunit